MSYSTSGTISEVLIGTGVLYIKDASTTDLAFPGNTSGTAMLRGGIPSKYLQNQFSHQLGKHQKNKTNG